MTTEIYNTKTKEMEPYVPENIETTPEETKQKSVAQTEKAVEDVKDEVDSRDSDILTELRNIHTAITNQNDHLMHHIESHSTPVTSSPPAQAVEQEANQVESKKEPGHTEGAVNMEIQEAKDLPKDKDAEHSRSRKFGKRGRRA